MNFTKLMWQIGLTKKKSELITPTLIDIFKISNKHFYSGNSNTHIEDLLGTSSLGMSVSGRDIYYVNLRNELKNIVLDNMLIYQSYEVGDVLKLSYQEKYEITFDYLPNDFETRSEIERRLIGCEVIEFEKI